MSKKDQSYIEDAVLIESLQSMFEFDEDKNDKFEQNELLNKLRMEINKKRIRKFKWISAVAAGILIILCMNVLFVPVEIYASKNVLTKFIIELKTAFNIIGGSTNSTLFELPYTKDIYNCMDNIAFAPYIPTFIPDEYTYQRVGVAEGVLVISFINTTNNEIIKITQQKADLEAMQTLNVKTSEGYMKKTVDINGNPGVLLETEKYKTLIWENGATYFTVICNIKEKMIMRIAGSMIEAEYNKSN